jgi:hypothetical protein
MHKHGGNGVSPADRVDMNLASQGSVRPQRPAEAAMGIARLAVAPSAGSRALGLPPVEHPRVVAPTQGRIDRREPRKAMSPMKTRRMKKTGILKFRIDADTYASLKSYCAQNGQSMSVVLRELLERELAKTAADGHESAAQTDGQIRFEQ